MADTAAFTKSSPICLLCDKCVSEDPHHMLFDCTIFDTMRTDLWYNVLRVAPDAMREELEIMNSRKKTEFIMSGMKCDYLDEWCDITAVHRYHGLIYIIFMFVSSTKIVC